MFSLQIIELLNKNYQQSKNLIMQSQNRAEYLAKIQQIRSRIQLKPKDYKDYKETKPKYQEITGRQNNIFEPKIDHYALIQQLQKRKPLQPAQNKVNQINQRVKQLDSVSDRIKNMLSTKRSTNTTNNNGNQQNVKEPLPSKYVSLFQRSIPCSESKVQTNLGEKEQSKERQDKLAKISSQVNWPQSKIHKQLPQKQSKHNNVYNSLEDYKKKYLREDNNRIIADAYQSKETMNTFIPLSLQKKQHNSDIKLNSQKIKNTHYEGKYSQKKKLIEKLLMQISLEVKLRNSKQKFDSFRTHNKWQLLQEQIAKKQIAISQVELRNWISIEQEEFDPFSSLVFTKDICYQELINNLVNAKNHWETIRHCCSKDSLSKQQFKVKQGVELIGLQDLVCFININTGNCFKNRDLFSIFRRILHLQRKQGSQSRIKEQTLLNYVSK